MNQGPPWCYYLEGPNICGDITIFFEICHVHATKIPSSIICAPKNLASRKCLLLPYSSFFVWCLFCSVVLHLFSRSKPCCFFHPLTVVPSAWFIICLLLSLLIVQLSEFMVGSYPELNQFTLKSIAEDNLVCRHFYCILLTSKASQ